MASRLDRRALRTLGIAEVVAAGLFAGFATPLARVLGVPLAGCASLGTAICVIVSTIALLAGGIGALRAPVTAGRTAAIVGGGTAAFALWLATRPSSDRFGWIALLAPGWLQLGVAWRLGSARRRIELPDAQAPVVEPRR